MNKKELLDAITRASRAMQEYRAGRITKVAFADSSLDRELEGRIQEVTVTVIKEASYMLGPSGQPCPICHGSGRI